MPGVLRTRRNLQAGLRENSSRKRDYLAGGASLFFASPPGAAGVSVGGVVAGVLAAGAAGGVVAGAFAASAGVVAGGVVPLLVAGAEGAALGSTGPLGGTVFSPGVMGAVNGGPPVAVVAELPSASPWCFAHISAIRQIAIQIEAVMMVIRVKTSPALAPNALEPPIPPSAPARPPPRPR